MAPYELLAEWSGRGWPFVANHLWQATLFSLLALAAAGGLRRAPAAARYYVWLTALLKFALPSALIVLMARGVGLDLPTLRGTADAPAPAVLDVSPILSPVSAPPPAPRRAPETIVASADETATAASPSAPSPRPFDFYVLLTLVWLAGCCLLLAHWFRQRRRLSAALRAGLWLKAGREVEALARVQGWLGRRAPVRLLVSRAVSEPGVWRVWRPVIVLPEGIADEMDDGELEAVLLHEFAHVERRDNLAANVQRFLCCVFWFHPLVWLIDRRLLSEREQACDDAVVRLSGASETYASSIAKVCRHFVGHRVAGVSGVGGSDLKRRLERILSERAGGRSSLPQMALVALIAASAVTLSLASGEGRDDGFAAVGVGVPTGAELAQEPDARFETSATAQTRARRGPAAEERGPVPAAEQHGRAVSQGAEIDLSETRRLPPLEVFAEGETVESSADAAGAITLELPEEFPPPEDVAVAERVSAPQAAVVKASEAEYGDLRRFIGRYEMDPNRAENFVIDIALEDGELWLKPSHTHKRRLIRQSEESFSDSSGKFGFTALLDQRGRVAGLRFDSWGRNVVARKLALPGPSLTGNVTFRLRGHAGARVVAVAGTFNNWNQSQLLFAREGDEWVCRVNLPPGKYQYKFIVDGDWLTDPGNPRTVEDERGFVNSLLRAD